MYLGGRIPEHPCRHAGACRASLPVATARSAAGSFSSHGCAVPDDSPNLDATAAWPRRCPPTPRPVGHGFIGRIEPAGSVNDRAGLRAAGPVGNLLHFQPERQCVALRLQSDIAPACRSARAAAYGMAVRSSFITNFAKPLPPGRSDTSLSWAVFLEEEYRSFT
jgi:hypothetical protein